MTNTPTPKTLNSVERRALERLTKNHFETLTSELDSLYNEAREQAHREYDAKLDASRRGRDAKVKKVRADLAKIVQKANADIDTLKTTAERDGYALELTTPGRYGAEAFTTITVTLADVDDAVAKKEYDRAMSDLRKAYDQGVAALRRKELEVMRELLLSALTSDTAKEFLNGLPIATDLFRAAAIES